MRSMQTMKPLLLAAVCTFNMGSLAVTAAETPSRDATPFAISTFHCLGLYWSPPGGTTDKEVLVRYRRQGATEWQEGLPMRYNPIAKTDEDLADYRGSIVHLAPASTYEIQLSLAGTATTANLTAATWSEEFPVGEVIRVGDRDTPLVITDSGTPQGYRVYDGQGATIDVRHLHDSCMTVNASHIILRGFTLRGAGAANVDPKRIMGAIQIDGGQDIVIEGCDISDWGRRNPATGFGFDYDAAIYSRSGTLKRLIVQRCKLHHPTFDGSTWYEPKYPTHTMGPQCITLFNTAGNHVIRYNECFSDLEHMYNDGIGGGSNGSFKGAPGPDSDIYGNVISHCWDDGLEVEGGSRNVRIWDNYFTQCMMMIGNAPASIGPLYIWRNVVTHSQSQPNAGGGNFLKMGFATSEDWMTGRMYIFHNTIFRSDEWLPTGGLGGTRIVKHTMSRNNILQVRASSNWSASDNKQNADNSFDHDLCNGRVPPSQEAHGVRGEPIYAAGAGFDPTTRIGSFQLAPDSPGVGAGQPLPNFSRGYAGKAPDLGAHQRGEPPIQYGVRANQPPKPATEQNLWTIGIYTGPSPFELSAPSHVKNPVLTGADVTDMKDLNVDTVAHPFMLAVGSRYYVFFTAKDLKADKGGIGLAESRDGLEWRFRRTVIREPFVLSHPCVFQWRDDYYLVPEAHTETSVRLYRATSFPDQWNYEGDLIKGDHFISPTLTRYQDMWWLFASAPGNGTLRLFQARDLKGPWTEHPRSPIVKDDLRTARTGGRPFVIDGVLYRLGMDCYPTYGSQVRAFQITDIGPSTYVEKMMETPLVKASSQGWNALAMHHVDALQTGAHQWMAAVDALGR